MRIGDEMVLRFFKPSGVFHHGVGGWMGWDGMGWTGFRVR